MLSGVIFHETASSFFFHFEFLNSAPIKDGRGPDIRALIPWAQGCRQQRGFQPEHEAAHLGLTGRMPDDLELQATAARVSLF
jgi:hypothetical protein